MPEVMKKYDYIVVGAGIIGLSVACEIKRRFPSSKLAVLDKEARVGIHASGRNSGVLHCGIYYDNDTIKAKVCASGAMRMMAFAEEHGIPYQKTGKVILATREHQLPAVERLLQNARNNGIRAQKIDQKELHDIEPACSPGVAAIYCPDTAIIDSLAVLDRIKHELISKGVDFHFSTEVRGLNKASTLHTTNGPITFGYMFNCAGAYADKLAKKFGLAQNYALVPFKGIYWKISPNASSLVRASIYPVPDISLPFLGVHLTRVISGDVYIGPTAIPTFGRENYGVIRGAKFSEAIQICRLLAQMYLRNQNNFRLLSHNELAKYRKKTFLHAAKELCPSLTEDDLVQSNKVGIRPQLINIQSRNLEMDFVIEQTDNSLHVLNAISPAFTSSIVLAELIVEKSGISGVSSMEAA